jgi:hypothetical protein
VQIYCLLCGAVPITTNAALISSNDLFQLKRAARSPGSRPREAGVQM